jgi:hypothetical protein
MSFRWVAFITLWTFLSGPILGGTATGPASRKPTAGSAKVVKRVPSNVRIQR